MWSHVILVSQTTVLLIESRLLLYSSSLNIVFNVVSSIFSRYMTDYDIMCVRTVRMYECIPVRRCICL